jgi:histidinol-phosphate aminotransferase
VSADQKAAVTDNRASNASPTASIVTGTLTAAPRVDAVAPYAPSRHGAPVDLDLAGSEGAGPSVAVVSRGLRGARQSVARYPDASALTRELAAALGVAAERVVVTAGADEAIDRVCRAVLSEGRNAIVTDPTFEMIPRYVALSGGTVRAVAWPGGAFPVEQVIAAADDQTALIPIVTPNNPTGAVATVDEIRRIHDAIPTALVLVDLAYIEYADTDITREVLDLSRVVVTRTLSKAFGMPGIRVGYAVASTEVAAWLRRVGGPYPVAAPSLDLARAALTEDPNVRADRIASVKATRSRFTAELRKFIAAPTESQASFVCATGSRARWLSDALAGQGIATRLFVAAEPGGTNRVRIAVPTDRRSANRLSRAVRTALDPQAILFDMDGVLADVSRSYDAAVVRTAAEFGVATTRADVLARRALGNANDDWALTAALIGERRRDPVSLADVTSTFEQFYQGADGVPGFCEREQLTVPPEWLQRIARRVKLGVVTGRPRADAEAFLARAGVRELFRAVITRDDAPLKPSPLPVQAALAALGVRRAWMLGDTPDDVASARGAGVVPIGVSPAGAEDGGPLPIALIRAGAACVVANPMEISQWLD